MLGVEVGGKWFVSKESGQDGMVKTKTLGSIICLGKNIGFGQKNYVSGAGVGWQVGRQVGRWKIWRYDKCMPLKTVL